MKCPYCNNEIPDFSKQCDICGVEIENKFRLSNANIRDTKNDKTIRIAYFTIMGLIFICIGGYILSQFGLMFLKENLYPLAGFSGIGLCLCGQGLGFIITGFNPDYGSKITGIFAHGYSFCFLIFWFGILISAEVMLFQDTSKDDFMPTFIFTLIFWAFGIGYLISTIKSIIKK